MIYPYISQGCRNSLAVAMEDLAKEEGPWDAAATDLVSDANDAAYRELLQQKSMQTTVMFRSMQQEAKSIMDLAESKRRQAGECSSVISANIRYVDNAIYQTINLGKQPQIDIQYCLHPLSPDECDIYSSLVEYPDCHITAMPNHCINSNGDAEGFVYRCDSGEPATRLPVCRDMFFRHSMVECFAEDQHILSLLLRPQRVLEKLVNVVQRIHEESRGCEATFDCMPENDDGRADAWGGQNFASSNIGSYLSQRTADCRDWKPEMPRMAGIFHAYIKDFRRSTRTHKMFLVVTGGCRLASDIFFNLFTDAQGHVTCGELVDSQEAWYLNNTSQRSNAKILHAIAKEFNFSIPVMQDTNSYHDNAEIANCCTETMLHSMHRSQKGGQVIITNGCTDPRLSSNGVLCSMHPTEGVWLFRGPAVTKNEMMNYGGTFGHSNTLSPLGFPTCTSSSSDNYSFKYKAPTGSAVERIQIALSHLADSSVVARLDSDARRMPPQEQCKHVCIDEAFMKKLGMLQWNRDHGVVELIPIAVVVTDTDAM